MPVVVQSSFQDQEVGGEECECMIDRQLKVRPPKVVGDLQVVVLMQLL